MLQEKKKELFSAFTITTLTVYEAENPQQGNDRCQPGPPIHQASPGRRETRHHAESSESGFKIKCKYRMPSPPRVFPQPLHPGMKPEHWVPVRRSVGRSVGALLLPGPSVSTRLSTCGVSTGALKSDKL